MKRMKWSSLIAHGWMFFLLFAVTPAAMAESAPKVSWQYLPAQNAIEQASQRWLKKSKVVQDAAKLINSTLRLQHPVQIVLGADDGPAFDPESAQILLPYHFVTEVQERFEQADYAQTGVTVQQATEHALLHTLFHELAHALIEINQLPVLGKEEDAADALATVLLVEFFEDGQELALSAADLFDLESTDITEFEEQDFWDEHSLDAQRYYSTLCHIYGSAPAQYADLVEQAEFSEDRAALCIAEYEQIRSGWLQVLEPFLMAP